MRPPVHCIWIIASKQHFDHPRCNAKNHWWLVNAHFQNGAVTISQIVLPMMAANTSVILDSAQITLHFPCLQDQILLILHWHTLWCIVKVISAAIDNCRINYFDLLVGILPDWDTALWQSWAQKYSCTGHCHATKIDISCWMIHFASYISVYEQIFTCGCSILSHNISPSEILGQAT